MDKTIKTHTHRVGRKSQKECVGVHPLLAACAWCTIESLKDCDATIFDGLRTLSEQKHYVLIGRSETLKSNHLPGTSVDIVPIIDGDLMWDANHIPAGKERDKLQKRVDAAYKEISENMHLWAKRLEIEVENLYEKAGWDKPHWNILNTRYDVRKLAVRIEG